ncbi:MAG: DUF4360 domain-containing protein [Bauldia sp.]
MKTKLGLLAAAIVLSTSPALAVDVCANGIPTDYSVGHAPDGLSHFAAFNNFVIEIDGGEPATATATCRAEIAPGDPTGYSVFTADYRGFALLDAGQTATFTAVGPDGTPFELTLNGPTDGDFDPRQFVGTAPGEALVVDLSLTLDAGEPGAPFTTAFLDTADFARVGFTTFGAVQASIDQLAAETAAVLGQLAGTADLLLGVLRPIEGPDEAGVIAAAGSGLLGATGRYNLRPGLGILGGVALFTQSAPGVEIGPSVLLAGAVRYVSPSPTPLRFLVEGAAYAAPSLDLTYSRQYQNIDEIVAVEQAATGFLLGSRLRAGILYDLNDRNEIALTAAVSHSSIAVRGYEEEVSLDNLFAATLSDSRAGRSAIEAQLAWTMALAETLDVTFTGTVGRTFTNRNGIAADVAFVDTVAAELPAGPYVQLGARLGWQPSERTTVEAFALTRHGPEIGTHTQFGAALRLSF